MRLRTWLLLGVAVLAGVYLIRYESHHSYYQSLFLSRYAKDLTFRVEDGPSDAVRFPQSGPFDVRLGYTAIPRWTPRLRQHGFELTSQARFSPELLRYVEHGLFPPYREKTQAGLQVFDCKGDSIYTFQYPQRAYASFEAIPPLLQRSLLFIENRRLLAPGRDRANPAVDWPRLVSASLALVTRRFDDDGSTHGASTLATQIEKFRHSPEGLTFEPQDKLLQMASASVRAYRDGPHTLPARQQLVLDYINTVPLAAAPGFGEVNGVGDAVWVWFGREFDRFNSDLRGAAGIEAQGQALRQGLAIFVAQRRPSYYLLAGREDLAELVDSHIRLLARDGIVDQPLRDAALKASFGFRESGQASRIRPVIDADKAVTVSRVRLANLLEQTLYAVDRMDLRAGSSLHADLQRSVSEYLERLSDPAFAEQAGLFGDRLLSAEKVAAVRYSFTLMQSTADGNQVRVQTDNTGLPFDLNEGSKLELGSTAKLRVLATYLQIIAELHASLADADETAFQRALAEPEDRLSVWVATTLRSNRQMTLPELLDAALKRRYSASPAERFYTGGGVQRFRNFRREDDGRNPTMRESLQESINLPFVRLQRDIVRYTIHQAHRDSTALLQNDRDPRREEYLERFADREGRTFLLRFWRKYQNKNQAERLNNFLEGLRPTATRLAAVHRYLYPDASQADLAAFLAARTDEVLGEKRIEELYQAYGPGKYNLPDQGYIARVHPLELWLLGYLIGNEGAIFADAVQASQAERQEVYGWLFRTRHRSARDNRIRTMLEVEAYLDIHARWEAMGYPFDHLVPSLGTALGSSGDRPAALAELMGIIQNGGVRYPTARITELHFAEGTPYETHFRRSAAQGRQVLAPEVAAALREALSQVVEDGTARRLQGTFTAPDGSPLPIGGKTGTGDNRIHSVAASGLSTGSQVLNRTATFVFFIGDDHFGTLTAFVPGQAASSFRFTSALPVQVLKGMAPMLTGYFEDRQAGCDAADVRMAAVD